MDKIFKLDSRNPITQNKITYKCINKYKKKDKTTDIKYYCNATIKGIRNVDNNTIFKYYISEKHSEMCSNNYNKLITKQNKLISDNNYLMNNNVEKEKQTIKHSNSSIENLNNKNENKENLRIKLTDKDNISYLSEPNSDSEEIEFNNLKDEIFNIRDFDIELKKYYKEKKILIVDKEILLIMGLNYTKN